jgi:hypothetical protein
MYLPSAAAEAAKPRETRQKKEKAMMSTVVKR